MKATVYKEFSDASSIIEIAPGHPLYATMAGLTPQPCRYFVDGKEVPGDYIPHEGQCVMVRSIPTGIETVIIIILAVIAVVGAIYGGVTAYKARKKANEIEEKMKEAMKGLNDTVQNLPHLRGANNAIATGKSQPYIIGEHLFTPYKLVKHWYKTEGTDGADQFYIDVYEGGFCPQVLREISAGEVKLIDFPGDVPQEGVYPFDATSPFYDADSFVEVSQDGAAFATADFNIKVLSEESGAELKKSDEDSYEDLIYILPRYARSADVCLLFNGLRGYNDEGAHITRTLDIVPSYSYDGGDTWTPFTFNQNGTPSNTFARDTMNQLRFIAHIDFVYATMEALTEPVQIKLVCSTPKATNSSYDQVYVESIQSVIYDVEASATAGAFVNEKIIDDVEAALSTRIGIKIKATASNQDKLNRINVITSGVARTWTGSAWTDTKGPTRNLAAWILEVLTSPTHTASRMLDAEIDLDAFGEAYEYYDTEGTTVDLALLDGDEKRSVLAAMCEIGMCSLYQNIYGEVSIAIDSVKENAIAVLNTQNLLSFEAEKGFNRKADGLRVSYISRDGGYQQDSYLVMRDGITRDANSLIRDIETSGITDHDQIVKYARRLMAIETLRPKLAKAKVGKEGVYYTPLSKVLVQHPALGNGLGSAEIKATVVESGFIVALQLYEPILYDSAETDGFGVIIQAVGADYSVPLPCAYTAGTNGMVDEIELVVPIAVGAAAIPHAGDILSYGYLVMGSFGTITSPMLIAGIENDDEGFTLGLVDYNEAIYDGGTIPDYVPNLTTIGAPSGTPGAPVTATDDAMIALAAAAASAAAAARASTFLTSSAPSVVRDRTGTNSPASTTFAAWLPGATPTAVNGRFRVYEDAGAGYSMVYESSADESSHVHTIGDGLIGIRCDFRVDVDGDLETIESLTIGVSLAPDSAPLYWGPRTSAPETGFLKDDFYFDANTVVGGGGKIRYYTGSTWAEATSAWYYFAQANAAALSDMMAWTNIYGSDLIAAVTAMITNLSAQSAFVYNFYAQDATITGKQRWYFGSGINRTCIEIYRGQIGFYDAPDTTPPTAETLRARFGRLGTGETVILDGENIVAPITSTWSAESVINNADSAHHSFFQFSDGEIRITYRRVANNYIYERIWSGTAWGDESLINGAASLTPKYIQLPDGEKRVAYIRLADGYVCERVWSGSAWGAEAVILEENCGAIDYIVTEDGARRLSYVRAADVYLVERVWSGEGFGDAVVINAAYSYTQQYIQLMDGSIRITYRKTGNYICERLLVNGAWGDEVVITGAGYNTPQYTQLIGGELLIIYQRLSDGYILKRSLTETGWGSESELVSVLSGGPACLQQEDGTWRFAYIKSSQLVERTLRRYARIGAGVTDEGVSTDGRSFWEITGNGRLRQWGWTWTTSKLGATLSDEEIKTFPIAFGSIQSFKAEGLGYKTGSTPTSIYDSTNRWTNGTIEARVASLTQFYTAIYTAAGQGAGAYVIIGWEAVGTPA